MKIRYFKITATLFLFFIAISTNAQFLTKVSIGIKAGTNFTIVNPVNKFSVIEGFLSETNSYDKEYRKSYNNYGSQFAFLFFYSLSDNMYLSFQPSVFNNRFKYKNVYNWTGSQYNLELTYDFEQSLQYLELPLLFKYEFGSSKLQPYIQLGGYYSLLLNSTKYISKKETGDFGTFESSIENIGSNENYIKSHIGLMAGLGITYKFKRTKIGLESNFRYGFNNITNTKNRYNNNQITGKSYDAPDDIKLMDFSISLVYIVSLKCIKKTIPPKHREY